MSTQPVQADVYDPTTDPRHAPPAAPSGPEPLVPKPRDVAPDQTAPLADEPPFVQPGGASTVKPPSNAESS
jgi:hypothetical protein